MCLRVRPSRLLCVAVAVPDEAKKQLILCDAVVLVCPGFGMRLQTGEEASLMNSAGGAHYRYTPPARLQEEEDSCAVFISAKFRSP